MPNSRKPAPPAKGVRKPRSPRACPGSEKSKEGISALKSPGSRVPQEDISTLKNPDSRKPQEDISALKAPGSRVPPENVPAQEAPATAKAPIPPDSEKSQASPDFAEPSGTPDPGAQSALLHALGLCARARALIFGTPMVCDAMRDARPPLLVLEASDTSENTHKKLTDKCTFYRIRRIRLPLDGETLAAAVGKGKASLAALGIRDAQFCRLLERPLKALEQP